MIHRLTASLDFASQALQLRAEKQRVIASNIANADTPGYQARDFDFATALRQASGGATSATAGTLGADIAANVMRSGLNGTGGSLAPRLQYAQPSQTSADSNTVDMDRERAAFVDNSVNYEATLRFINGSVRTMLEAMKSANQG